MLEFRVRGLQVWELGFCGICVFEGDLVSFECCAMFMDCLGSRSQHMGFGGTDECRVGGNLQGRRSRRAIGQVWRHCELSPPTNLWVHDTQVSGFRVQGLDRLSRPECLPASRNRRCLGIAYRV
jgi:hypothetical protein